MTELARVLVVDDDRDSADSLGQLLRLYGFSVEAVYSAECAMELVARKEFEVLLADLGMPVHTGFRLAQEIRKDPGNWDIVLIALTGYADPESRRRSLEAGFHCHLVKPVSAEELLAVLRQIPRKRIKEERLVVSGAKN